MTIKKDIKFAQDKRFIEVAELLKNNNGLTEKDIYESLGLTASSFSDIRNGRRSVTTNVLGLFKQLYPQADLNFILTGIGEPLTNVVSAQKVVHEGGYRVLKETEPVYNRGEKIRILSITQDPSGNENIEMVNSKAAASYIDNIQEPEYMKSLAKLNIPLNDFKGGSFRAFQVKGNSMEPTILQNSWVIGQFVENWTESIKDDYIYVIVSKDAILVKRILNRIEARKELVLKSDNREFESKYIDIDDVTEVWRVKGELRFSFKDINKDMYLDVQHLLADMEDVKMELRDLRGKNKHIEGK